MRRRREAAQGTLSPTYREALAVILGLDKFSRRKANNETRWQQRLGELQNLRAAGGNWHRHQKTDDTKERTLGVWLHEQRIKCRAGRLSPAKEKKLNEALPGWREGRGHRGGCRATHNPNRYSGQLRYCPKFFSKTTSETAFPSQMQKLSASM